MRRPIVKKIRTQGGAAAIEFALVLPLLIALLFGIIEFSLVLYDKAMITNASREGARQGIVFRVVPVTGDRLPLSEGEIGAVVNSYLANRLITFGGPVTATTTAARAGTYPDEMLTVNVGYTYTFLVLPGFVAGLVGGINLDAQTVMRME